MGTLAFLSAMLWPTDRRLSMEVAEAPLQLSLPFIAPGFQALGCCITTAIAVERGSAIWHLQAWYGRLVSRGRVPIILFLFRAGPKALGLLPLFYSAINAPLRILFLGPPPETTLQGGTFPLAVIHGHRTPKALHPVRSAKLTGVPPS
jgi:hypothetical protein